MHADQSAVVAQDLSALDVLAVELWRDAADLYGFPRSVRGAHYRWLRLQDAKRDGRFTRTARSAERLDEMIAQATKDLVDAPTRDLADMRCKLAYLDFTLQTQPESGRMSAGLGDLDTLLASLARANPAAAPQQKPPSSAQQRHAMPKAHPWGARIPAAWSLTAA